MQGVRFEHTYSCETGSWVQRRKSSENALWRVSEEFDQAWLSLHIWKNDALKKRPITQLEKLTCILWFSFTFIW